MNKVIISNPKYLFIIDGFGAALSAFSLGVILMKFETFFGIPKSVLQILAVIPLFFILYDIYGYKSIENKTPKLLKGIGVVNILYCILSIGFTLMHYSSITVYGWLYIIVGHL